MAPTILTLLTDFGLQDEFVGVMKGVIWGIAPQLHIVDITHAVPPQNVLHGALLLGRAYHYFPAGTIHVVVVDPGVGTDRRGLVLKVGDQFFVGPDNGVFTIPLQSFEPFEAYALENTGFRLSSLSQTFHGRDVFAPAAAYLANGAPLASFGAKITTPIMLDLPRPLRIGKILEGQILSADSFGNLITNINRSDLREERIREIRCADHIIQDLSGTFGDASEGDLIAIIDSSNALSLCVVNGSAKERLMAVPGFKVELIFE